MPTVVDICNLALSRLGDRATVTSIDPPEGSAQADHCARFFTLARDTALEEASWTFATRREALTKTTFDTREWLFAYFVPNDCLNVQRLVHGDQPCPDGTTASGAGGPGYVDADNIPYIIETDTNGREIILTNLDEAYAIFTARIVNPARYPAQFVNALTYLLASYLAGPVLKGRTGERASTANYNAYMALVGKTAAKDANQSNYKREYVPQAMVRRGVSFPRARRIYD